jgi:serine/threonine-protein kinase HipA
MAQIIGNTWRDDLRHQGLGGAGLNACAPAFEHERTDAALGL